MDDFLDKEQEELILCYRLAVLVLLLPAKLPELFLLGLVSRRCILRPGRLDYSEDILRVGAQLGMVDNGTVGAVARGHGCGCGRPR